MRPVRIYGDPVLRQRAREVAQFDDSLQGLVEDLKETMKAYNGVGLAANQVGVLQRVLVVDVPLEDAPRVQLTLVNPVIESRSGRQPSEEGCLSIPGIVEEIQRAKAIRMKARDEHGAEVVVDADGYVARALQHELDHLDGVLFVDRVGPLKKQFLRRDLEALARGEIPENYHPPAGRL